MHSLNLLTVAFFVGSLVPLWHMIVFLPVSVRGYSCLDANVYCVDIAGTYVSVSAAVEACGGSAGRDDCVIMVEGPRTLPGDQIPIGRPMNAVKRGLVIPYGGHVTFDSTPADSNGFSIYSNYWTVRGTDEFSFTFKGQTLGDSLTIYSSFSSGLACAESHAHIGPNVTIDVDSENGLVVYSTSADIQGVVIDGVTFVESVEYGDGFKYPLRLWYEGLTALAPLPSGEPRVRVSNCVFLGPTPKYSVILVSRMSWFELSGNFVQAYGATKYSLFIYEAADGLIHNNVFEDQTAGFLEAHVYFQSGATAGYPSQRNVFRGNTFVCDAMPILGMIHFDCEGAADLPTQSEFHNSLLVGPCASPSQSLFSSDCAAGAMEATMTLSCVRSNDSIRYSIHAFSLEDHSCAGDGNPGNVYFAESGPKSGNEYFRPTSEYVGVDLSSLVPMDYAEIFREPSKYTIGALQFSPFECDGIPHKLGASVCGGGHGECVAPDVCVCTNATEYNGTFCESPRCDGILEGHGATCSNRGNCTAFEYCECANTSQWTGQYCDMPVCDGKPAGTPGVCSDHGTCSEFDLCACNISEWTGEWCEIPLCNGKPAGTTGVCSNHGTCSGFDECECTNASKWTGQWCEVPVCNRNPAGTPGVCSDHGSCSAVDVCACTNASEWTGEWCAIPVCNGRPAGTAGVCSDRGVCTASSRCECNSVLFVDVRGSWCEVYEPPTPISFDDVEEIVQYVLSGVAALLTLLGVGIVIITVVLCCYRRAKAKKLRRIVLAPQSDETPPEEKVKETISISKDISELRKALEANDTEEIERLCSGVEERLVQVGASVANPGFVAGALGTVLRDKNVFPHLALSSQVMILRVFERLLSVVLIYHNDDVFDFDFHEGLQERLEAVVEKMRKKSDGKDADEFAQLEFLVISVSHAIRSLRVEEKTTFGSILKSLFALGETAELLRGLKKEWGRIGAKWYAKLLSLRCLGFQAFSDTKKCDALISMIATELRTSKRKRRGKNVSWFYYLQGIVYLLRDLIIYSPVEEVCKRAFSGMVSSSAQDDEDEAESAGLVFFAHYEDSKSDGVNSRLRGLCLNVVDLVIRAMDQRRYLQAQLQQLLVHRIVLEPEAKIRTKIERLRDIMLQECQGEGEEGENAFVGYAETVRMEGPTLVKELDARWATLKSDEMLTNRLSSEIREKRLLLQEMEAENAGRNRLFDVEVGEAKKRKQTLEQDLVVLTKQLRLQRERCSAEDAQQSPEEVAKSRESVERKLAIEMELSRVAVTLNSKDFHMQVILKAEEEINALKKQTEDAEAELAETLKELETRKVRHAQTIKNYHQIRADYELALRLQQEIIEEKTKRLQPSGDTAGQVDVMMEALDLQAGEQYDETPPEDLCCPISMELMVHPVLVMESGQSYEKANIERWLKDHDTDPFTGQKLETKQMAPVFALKRQIEDWKEAHRAKVD